MTFGPHHYVPVLKVKRGEKAALGQLKAGHTARITPMLEIVERKDKALDKHLDTAFSGLARSVGAFARCFLDAGEIAHDGQAAAEEVFQRASSSGMSFAPVTGVSRAADVQAALRHRAGGLVLRLSRAEFEDGNLSRSLDRFMTRHGLARREVDLVIDLGPVEDMIVDGVVALTRAFLREVPAHGEWRTFTLSACAFPLSMAIVGKHSHESIERTEWRAWMDHLYADRAALPRLPSFSDCAIQHPSGVEGFDPKIMAVSAAVRYAQTSDWLLIKGESTRAVLPSVQFPELAKRLVYGQLKARFAGLSHCAGCGGIKRAADGADGFGSAEVWRKLGTIHHISTVIDGLAALAWP